MAKGIDGKLVESNKARVSLDSSGNGTKTVSFEEDFFDAPSVLVVGRRADSGAYTAAGVTKSGFTLTVTGSDIESADLDIPWLAHEKS